MFTTIASCVGRAPSRDHVLRFIDLCIRMAKVYLHRRARAGRLDPDFFGLTLDDLAVDCVADLFERDDTGRFPQLVAYFEPLLTERPSDARLIGATRRLVFSKVSEGLYRRYHEADPTLHKLIRNLRYAIRTGEVGNEDRIRGQLWVLFTDADPTNEVFSRPVMSEDLLQVRLSGLVHASANLKDVLASVRLVTQREDVYAPGYPLVGLATVLRDIFNRQSDEVHPNGTSLHELHREDLDQLLQAAKGRVECSMRQKYVGSKLTSTTFTAYIEAARDALSSEFVESGADDASHFDVLHPYLHEMSYEDFRAHHRGRFQYIVKKMRDDFLDTARHHVT